MKFNVKFEKNLREELSYSCVDRKTEFILFYSYIKRYLRIEDLTIFGVFNVKHTEIKMIMPSINMPIGSLEIIDLMQGNTIIDVSIEILRNLLAIPMTQ